MTYGLAVYDGVTETFFTRNLFNLFHGVSFQYPIVPTNVTDYNNSLGLSPTFVQTLNITLPTHSGDVGWSTSPIRSPIDQVIDLGGPVNGVGYNGYTFECKPSIVSVVAGVATITIQVFLGDPTEPSYLSFYTKGGNL